MTMDDMTELLELGAETDAKKTEKQMVNDLQAFIDDHQNLDDELVRLDAGEIINEGISELDRNCDHYGEQVGVHGTVLMAYYDPIEEEDKVSPFVMTGQKLKSSGFTVQRVANPDGSPGRAIVGHLFESTQEDIPNSETGLVQTTRQYFAFAPYGTVDIEANRTRDESVKRLWSYIPEVMQDIDDALLESNGKIGDLMALRKFSYETDKIPANILEELVQYVNSTVSPENIGPLTAEINGVYSVDIMENGQAVIPLDINDTAGGTGIVMGSPRYLFLSQYASYVEGATYESKDYYWSVGLTVHRAEARHARLEGQTIDVMLGDLRNPILVDLSKESEA